MMNKKERGERSHRQMTQHLRWKTPPAQQARRLDRLLDGLDTATKDEGIDFPDGDELPEL